MVVWLVILCLSVYGVPGHPDGWSDNEKIHPSPSSEHSVPSALLLSLQWRPVMLPGCYWMLRNSEVLGKNLWFCSNFRAKMSFFTILSGLPIPICRRSATAQWRVESTRHYLNTRHQPPHKYLHTIWPGKQRIHSPAFHETFENFREFS